MTSEQFKTILDSRLSSIRSVLGQKAKEYAIGDRLYNFKRAAEILRQTPQQALAGMLMKHVVSVLDLVEGSIPATEHMINEKIGDAINYMILLEALLKEEEVQEDSETSNEQLVERVRGAMGLRDESDSEPEPDYKNMVERIKHAMGLPNSLQGRLGNN